MHTTILHIVTNYYFSQVYNDIMYNNYTTKKAKSSLETELA